MAWIESHQSLGGHLKLRRLARLLRIHRAQAIGHLHILWWWALDGAPTGDLSALTSAEIAEVADWPGDADAFVAALRACGWIDPDGRLHDWQDYGGRLNRKRDLSRERQGRWRQRQRDGPVDNEGVTRYTPVTSRVSHDPTLHYSTEQKSRESEQARAGPLAELSVEAPPGFPRTEEEAVASGEARGAPAEFARKLWLLAASRGWRDAKGIPIRHWASYLAASLTFASEDHWRRRVPERNGHRGPRGPSPGHGGEQLRAPLL